MFLFSKSKLLSNNFIYAVFNFFQSQGYQIFFNFWNMYPYTMLQKKLKFLIKIGPKKPSYVYPFVCKS